VRGRSFSLRALAGRWSLRRRAAAATLILSTGMAVAIPAWWWSAGRPRVEAGAVPAIGSSPAGAAAVLPTARADPLGLAVPAIEVSSARLADRRPKVVGPPPARLRIPSIGVDAAIVPVALDEPTGSMEIPADIATVGWYRFGPSPGQAGSSLLVGHVDSSALGAGVFFKLRMVRVGSVVSITFADGAVARFRVMGRRSYPKAELPEELFARSGNPVLTLITCGGAFDRSTRHYVDNVVVYAIPADGEV
jgi:sortase (surface protein transpeptidase)